MKGTTHTMRFFRTFLLAQLAISALVAAGCGSAGPGSHSALGSATLLIQFPNRAASSRLIPAATQSIRVTLSGGPSSPPPTVVNNPPTGAAGTVTVPYPNLIVGTYAVSAVAYPQPNGAGTPVASGSATLVILANQNTTVTLTMGTTITRVALTLTFPQGTPTDSAGNRIILSGQSIPVTASATDANGNAVLVPASAATWKSSDPNVVSVIPDATSPATKAALVGGAAAGTATVTYTYQESDIAGRPTQVAAQVTVSVVTSNGPLGSRFAFVVNSGAGTVSSYTVDPNTSILTASGTAQATGATPRAAVADPSGQFLYVVNGGGGSVSAYTIDQLSGQLTPFGPFTGSPYTAGVNPTSIAFDPSGQYVYVANNGSNDVSVFSFDSGSGVLTRSGTAVPSAGASSTGANPAGLVAASPGNSGARYVYVANSGLGSVAIFSVTGGTLNFVGNTAVGSSPWGLALSPDNTRLFVTSLTGNSISAYTIDPATGNLTQAGATLATGASPAGVTVDPSGKYVYVANRDSNSISIFAVQANGSLVKVTDLALTGPGTSGPVGLSFDALGKFLYVTYLQSQRASLFRMDPGTGQLSPVLDQNGNPSGVQTGANPVAVVLSKGSVGSAAVTAQ